MDYSLCEVLAPVGGPQHLLAAVRSGADAVYLGLKQFSARKNAENFTNEDLIDAIKYCRKMDVRVHIAVNTLFKESEISVLDTIAEVIANVGADAVIVQDFAVANYFKKHCPTISLHASTQCAVHNTDGAKLMEDMGFSRFVLARELSLNEIEKINKSVSIESEAFIHGALCMSLSGGCYMSSVIGERSGNRGLCAQPCRLNFQCRGRDYALSLKDMSHISNIRALADVGVSSFKIEGRMKRPEYVAAATSACKKALMGEEYDADSLKRVFSRNGFTDGYIRGNRNIDMFGHREKDDVQAMQGVLKSLTVLYKDEPSKIPLDFILSLGNESKLTVKDNHNNEVVVYSEQKAEIPRSLPMDEAYCEKLLKKCGGTGYYANKCSLENPDKLTLSASSVNLMRRTALDKLSEMRAAIVPHKFIKYEEDEQAAVSQNASSLRAYFTNYSQIPEDLSNFEYVILPVDVLLEHSDLIDKIGNKIIASPPSIVWPENEDINYEKLKDLHNKGIDHLYCENVWSIKAGINCGYTLHLGPLLNITNNESLYVYKNLIQNEGANIEDAVISFELPIKDYPKKLSLKCGRIGYGYLPLMRVRACPARINGKICKSCSGKDILTDRYGKEFPFLCEGRKYVTIFNSLPLYMGDKRNNISFEILTFTIETKEQVKLIIDRYLEQDNVEGITRGLYYRELN